MEICKTQSFGAHFTYGVKKLASDSVKNGMSKKYVQGIMKKINKLFPGKDYVLYYCNYDDTKFGNNILATTVTIEKKNPLNRSPFESIYKKVIWPKSKANQAGGIVDNELVAFYKAVKELAKKDFSFEKICPVVKTQKKFGLHKEYKLFLNKKG